MSKATAVSFEEDIVKVVHVTLKGRNLFVNRTETIANEQFDDYLRKEKSKEFIVIHEFSESPHEIISIPVVKKTYLNKIIEAEIRKTIGISDFTFIYTSLGEDIVGGRKVKKIFYLTVKNEEILQVVKRFYDAGKIVKALYPRSFAVALLPIFNGEPIIWVLGTKTEKNTVLLKNGTIYFLRRFRSLTLEISDMDIQDINMTINYCIQNIRIMPSLIMLSGDLSESCDIKSPPAVPLACIYKADNIYSSQEIFNDFFIPISSFFTNKSSNILNREFKEIYIFRKYMSYATKVFILLTILCLGIVFYEIKNMADKKTMLSSLKRDNADIENISSEYSAKQAEISRYMPIVNFLNKPSPNIQRLLIAFATIDIKNVKFNSIEATTQNDTLAITINGIIDADTYVSTYGGFQDVTNSLAQIEGIKITEKTMDIEKKNFSIKMDYKISESEKF